MRAPQTGQNHVSGISSKAVPFLIVFAWALLRARSRPSPGRIAGAGLAMGLNDCFSPWGWNIAYGLGDKFAYMACTSLSGAVIAGLLSWIATRGLARTGALSAFASRRAASEPVL